MRVLVTGGSMGIGRAVAERLAAGGAGVVVAARGEAPVEETLAALPGTGHHGLALDVALEASWESADLGPLDGLVHAAGVLDPVGPIGEYAPRAFRDTVAVNLFGTQMAVHFCLPHLRPGSGIVTFSGGGGTSPLPRFDAYAASKAAVVRLTENLAPVLAERGLRINAIAPGFVATRMQQSVLRAGPQAAGDDYFASTRRQVAEGGVPPEQAAELAAFLLSPESEGISGKLISARWDPWQEEPFRQRLRTDPDFAVLRRAL